tara:strand:- start:2419 stop:2760 length:342 start_codon:yes stop_codon:yes gene_type:complete
MESFNMRLTPFLITPLFVALSLTPVDAQALNVQKELQKQGCLKCHAISRQKDGPSIKETAKKYRELENGKEALRAHLTSAPEIEVDGKKEKHKMFEPKSDGDLDEVIEWILSH